MILGNDILPGWTKSIEPNFIYWYFFQLSPWPTAKEIGACVQELWNWRFGAAHLRDFETSPQHLQLVRSLQLYEELQAYYFVS